ncbi:cyclodeaminase/cyclohydrolase family protein [candidate division NPL-UPA2 bacterium]|nr:cyclodeaminase/cyclohydrolase family protein [candidate division NPL-UPA2 bacterium]
MYINRSLQKYLDEAAAKLPAPGGGSVSALCGALGATMVSMVANFTVGKEKYKEVENEVRQVLSQSEELRKRLAELMDADVEAYGKVSTAYRLPKATDEEKGQRSQAIEEACKEALKVPLKIAVCCHQILKLSQRLVDISNINLVSDVGVAVILAEAALQGAALNVEINLVSLRDKSLVKENKGFLEYLLKESPVIKDKVLGKVKRKMRGDA